MTKAETIIDVPYDDLFDRSQRALPGHWRITGELVSIICPQCWDRVIFVDPNSIKKQCAAVKCGCGFERVCRLIPKDRKGGTES